jgi:hypothetical protein
VNVPISGRTEGCALGYHSPKSHKLQRASIITRPLSSDTSSVCQSRDLASKPGESQINHGDSGFTALVSVHKLTSYLGLSQCILGTVKTYEHGCFIIVELHLGEPDSFYRHLYISLNLRLHPINTEERTFKHVRNNMCQFGFTVTTEHSQFPKLTDDQLFNIFPVS